MGILLMSGALLGSWIATFTNPKKRLFKLDVRVTGCWLNCVLVTCVAAVLNPRNSQLNSSIAN